MRCVTELDLSNTLCSSFSNAKIKSMSDMCPNQERTVVSNR